jgi:hypothetical protein
MLTITLLLAAAFTNTTLWQAINSTATQLPATPGTPTSSATVTLMDNTSVVSGMPGYVMPMPMSGNLTRLQPYNGSMASLQQHLKTYTRLHSQIPPPLGPESLLHLVRSLILEGQQGKGLPVQLDMAGMQGIFRLSPAGDTATQNSSANNTSTAQPPVTLTFSNLTLINLPPGPPSTYPLGMSTLMMWSIDMDRWGTAVQACIAVGAHSPCTGENRSCKDRVLHMA